MLEVETRGGFTGQDVLLNRFGVFRADHLSQALVVNGWWWCLVAKWCPALCDPMDCSPPASSIHGISQARILEWVAIPSSRGSSWPKCMISTPREMMSKKPLPCPPLPHPYPRAFMGLEAAWKRMESARRTLVLPT